MTRQDDFDLSGLSDFTGRLLHLADVQFPKESRRFMQQEGNKLRRITAAKARRLVKRRSGKYLKGIKRGKVYKYKGQELAVRVYDSSPHAHLIEHGHRQVTKDGREVGFVRGKKVFEKSRAEFADTFAQDCEDFVDEMLARGLR
ncbi:HK97 gp10 family phage protein [Paenibacillus chibensis]|uniref:HK97 gp10 family phage protein n=1 Tax=Paenibacillus chibensis TaxID=59846 RepID=A0ABU6PV14_9BACL|nr:HK97 gp10 family phage protein [Paenibacillus chibensis]